MFTGQFHEPFLQSALDIPESFGVARFTKSLLGQMTKEISDVQSRVSLTIQVKVHQPQAFIVHDHLRGIEVAMDSARGQTRHSHSCGFARCEQALETCGPVRPHYSHSVKAFA